MVSRFLALLVLISLAFPTRTQAHAAAEKQAMAIKIKIRDAYARGLDLKSLDLPALRARSDAKASQLLDLYEQAIYVQDGREPNAKRDVYVAFVRSVARRLGTRSDKAVELYGERVSQRSTAASAQKASIRAALALDIQRNPDIPEATRARIAKNLAEAGSLLDGKTGDATAPSSVAGHVKALPLYVDAGAARSETDLTKIPPRVKSLPLMISPTPAPTNSPPATSYALSWNSLNSYLDWGRGKRVAVEAFNNTLNYVKRGKCYQVVKQALINAGIWNVPNPQSTAIIGLRPDAAWMFSADVKKDPKILAKMGYREVQLSKIGNDPSVIPDGSMLIYGKGCSFADKYSGHAELIVSERTYAEKRARNRQLQSIPVNPDEIRVCHYTCTKRTLPFLRTWGKKGCLKMYVPVKSA